MNKKDKVRFIKDLCNSVKNELISKIDKIPENWDGYELRELIAQKFRSESYLMNDKRSKRYRDFENDVIVQNL